MTLEYSTSLTTSPLKNSLPLDERRENVIRGRSTDSFLINRSVPQGDSAANADVPFINSAYTLAAVLKQYIEQNLTNPHLQQDICNITRAFVAFTCISGFHSLPKIMDVLHSAVVTEVLEEHALKINDPLSKNVLDKAVSSVSETISTRGSW